MRFTLNQLRAFECVSRLGGFHAAARELGLSQPTVYQRVRELEAAIGQKLFERRGRKVQLLPEGHELLDYADLCLGIAEEITERFSGENQLKGTLRLGLTDSFAMLCLVEMLRRVEKQYPDIKLSVQIVNSAEMSRMMNDRQMDLAVISDPEMASHVRHEPIGYNELAWFASTKLKLPSGVLKAGDLVPHHLILHPAPSRLHESVVNWLAAARASPTRISTCNNLSLIMMTIMEGAAIGMTPACIMREAVKRGRVRRLNVSAPIHPHQVSICYQPSGSRPAIQAVVGVLRELIAERKPFLPL